MKKTLQKNKKNHSQYSSHFIRYEINHFELELLIYCNYKKIKFVFIFVCALIKINNQESDTEI